MKPYFETIENSKGKTIGELKSDFKIVREKMRKGASGLIVEGILGIKNNNLDEPDLPEIGCEIKVLPLQINNNGEIKAKEPTAIQMIDYITVANENWENAKIRRKITLTFWVVYLAKEKSKVLQQNDYVIVDYFLDSPSIETNIVFKKDWEDIQNLIIKGLSDKLSCSMGIYIEPKTKGANNRDLTNAPDGKGGLIKVRRRAFYYKKNFTNKEVINNIDFSPICSRIPCKS